MIYKTLKKVSDYCQVLDKRTYPATGTENGITFTHNGDGSYTANGTFASSVGSYFYFCNTDNKNPVKLVANHKYIVLNGAYYEAGTYSVWMVVNNQLVADSNATILTNDYNGKTYTPKKNEEASLSMDITHNPNVDTINFTFKPQLFDLTEMYGAGNEPTTVEEFRQDFPEELYDYKPYCFVKSYKTCLTCTTKNLFDISKVPTISGRLIVKDNSICSYAYPAVTNDTNLLSIFKSLKPDTNYTMSATTINYLGNSTGCIMLVFSDNSLITIYGEFKSGYSKCTFSLTQEQINNITYVFFYGGDESRGGPTIWRNIQLEEGSTASEYQPYGYIQSRKKSLKVSNSILL